VRPAIGYSAKPSAVVPPTGDSSRPTAPRLSNAGACSASAKIGLAGTNDRSRPGQLRTQRPGPLRQLGPPAFFKPRSSRSAPRRRGFFSLPATMPPSRGSGGRSKCGPRPRASRLILLRVGAGRTLDGRASCQKFVAADGLTDDNQASSLSALRVRSRFLEGGHEQTERAQRWHCSLAVAVPDWMDSRQRLGGNRKFATRPAGGVRSRLRVLPPRGTRRAAWRDPADILRAVVAGSAIATCGDSAGNRPG
jgi:hypothetical protein